MMAWLWLLYFYVWNKKKRQSNLCLIDSEKEKTSCLYIKRVMHLFVLQVNAINYVLLPVLFRSLHTLFVSCIHCFLLLLLFLLAVNKTLFSCIISLVFFRVFSSSFNLLFVVVSSPLYTYSVCGRGIWTHSKWNGELNFHAWT